MSTISTLPYAKELQISISAVLKASLLAQDVQARLIGSGGVTKKDLSPVTVADYSAQALISTLLLNHFPTDLIVGEEDSSDLLLPVNLNVKNEIINMCNQSLISTLPTEEEFWWTGVKSNKTRSEKDWLNIIDRGNSEGGNTGRHWAIDPIDGTKGFLRGGQYAVCLGLLLDGKVVLGVIGCPNLPVNIQKPEGEKGVIFVTVKGQGAFSRSLSSPILTKITMNKLASLSDATFCESVEAGHSDHSTNSLIAKNLGIEKNQSVRMDSQAKYCSISRGAGDIYLRLPVSDTYEEKIWDHSSGSLLVAEAGGRVSDMNGNELDFSIGRTLKANKGVIACHVDIWEQVITAVKSAVDEKRKVGEKL